MTDEATTNPEELPTPDELLLELMDLVQLAFPTSVASMTVAFRPNEDGARPALTDLSAEAGAHPADRPELGHDDQRVLDAINALLADFADATLRQGKVRVLSGRIEVKTDADGARNVALHDDDHTGEPVMTRRFDASELRWLFFTHELFTVLNASAAREAEQRTALDAELARYQRFSIDMAKGQITFTPKDDTIGRRTFRFELVGSHLEQTQRFLWGWANESAPAPFTRRGEALRAASTGPGLRALTEGSYGCPEQCAERLARHAASTFTAARGLYRAGFKGRNEAGATSGFMYLALFDGQATGNPHT